MDAIVEAAVEHIFSKMGLMMTKKQCSLEDESLEILMIIFWWVWKSWNVKAIFIF